jgi:hypothetical protein
MRMIQYSKASVTSREAAAYWIPRGVIGLAEDETGGWV